MVQSGRTYKLVNEKAGTVLDLFGADNRQTIGYDYHGGDNQKVRDRPYTLHERRCLDDAELTCTTGISGCWSRRTASGSSGTSRRACTSASRAKPETGSPRSRRPSASGGTSGPMRRTSRLSGAHAPSAVCYRSCVGVRADRRDAGCVLGCSSRTRGSTWT